MTGSLTEARKLRAVKIVDCAVYRFDIPVREPFAIATMTATASPNVLVGLTTDEGLVGWGEASPLHAIVGETQATCLSAGAELARLMLGQDPLAIADRVEQMERTLPHNTTIKSAFDSALHDIAAQAAGMPLWQFLGGSPRRMETDLTVSIGDVESAARKATETVERGFRIIKTKVGRNHAEDLARLKAVRQAVGADVRLRIDANQGWDRVEAVKALRAVEPLDVEFCEQPVRAGDLDGLRWVSERCAIPVMADESVFGPEDALRLVRAQAAPYVNIKLSKAGGIRRALRVATIAEAAGLSCMVGCMLESRIGLTAAAHMAAVPPNVRFYDLDSFLDHAEDPVLGGVTVKDGVVELPNEPGLGARPDPAWLGRLERVV